MWSWLWFALLAQPHFYPISDKSCVFFSRVFFSFLLFILFRTSSNIINNQTHYAKIILSWCLWWVCICPDHFPPSVKRDDSHTPIPYLSISLFLHFSFSFLFGFGLFVSSSLMSLHLLRNHSYHSVSYMDPIYFLHNETGQRYMHIIQFHIATNFDSHFFPCDIFMCI